MECGRLLDRRLILVYMGRSPIRPIRVLYERNRSLLLKPGYMNQRPRATVQANHPAGVSAEEQGRRALPVEMSDRLLVS
jgi:hypothetical protein